jgi:DNA topoisomerase-1
MNLMIVESPNKVKKIKTFLGPGWDVAASVGHVRDLPVKSLGMTTPDYQLQYEYTERGKGVVEGLKPRAARADHVYLATDPDREGEAIAWHLKETLQLRRYHPNREQALDAESQPAQRHRANEEGANSTLPRPCLLRHQMMRRSQGNL